MSDDEAVPGEVRRRATIRNTRGLHARAAAKFVKCVESHDAEVWVLRHELTVSGRSIMGLMMLAAAPGACIELRASGPQADAAMAALVALIEDGFGERD